MARDVTGLADEARGAIIATATGLLAERTMAANPDIGAALEGINLANVDQVGAAIQVGQEQSNDIQVGG